MGHCSSTRQGIAQNPWSLGHPLGFGGKLRHFGAKLLDCNPKQTFALIFHSQSFIPSFSSDTLVKIWRAMELVVISWMRSLFLSKTFSSTSSRGELLLSFISTFQSPFPSLPLTNDCISVQFSPRWELWRPLLRDRDRSYDGWRI